MRGTFLLLPASPGQVNSPHATGQPDICHCILMFLIQLSCLFFFFLYCSLFYLHIPSNSSHLITEIPQNVVLRCGCDGLWMLIYTAVQLVVAVVLSFKVALYSPWNQWCHPGCQSYPCGQVGQRLWPVPGAGCSPSQACLLCSWPWETGAAYKCAA